MKVRRSSWHYRMQRFLYSMWKNGPDFVEGARSDPHPTSLCSYFWLTVALVILIPIWAIAAIGFLILLAIAWSAVTIYELLIEDRWVAYRSWRRAKKNRKEVEKITREDLPPNMMITYLKSRKAKACPRIELVDD